MKNKNSEKVELLRLYQMSVRCLFIIILHNSTLALLLFIYFWIRFDDKSNVAIV